MCSTAPATRSFPRSLTGLNGLANVWPRKDETTPPRAHQFPVTNPSRSEPTTNAGITKERARINRTALDDLVIRTRSRAAAYSMPRCASPLATAVLSAAWLTKGNPEISEIQDTPAPAHRFRSTSGVMFGGMLPLTCRHCD